MKSFTYRVMWNWDKNMWTATYRFAVGVYILSKTSNQQCTFKWMPLT